MATAVVEKVWTNSNIDTHPAVKVALTAQQDAEKALSTAYQKRTTLEQEMSVLWSRARPATTDPSTTVLSLEAQAAIEPVRRRWLEAQAVELRASAAAEHAREDTRTVIYKVLEPQLARQARARAAALEAVHDTHDRPVAATEVLIHERAHRPIEGWVGLHTDYAARVRERFGDA
jgi:hypothetical protein